MTDTKDVHTELKHLRQDYDDLMRRYAALERYFIRRTTCEDLTVLNDTIARLEAENEDLRRERDEWKAEYDARTEVFIALRREFWRLKANGVL